MERGLHEQACSTIDAASPTESGENAVAALLRIRCRSQRTPTPQPDLDLALQEVPAMVSSGDASTAVFQARAGLAVLDLAGHQNCPRTASLHEAVAGRCPRPEERKQSRTGDHTVMTGRRGLPPTCPSPTGPR